MTGKDFGDRRTHVKNSDGQMWCGQPGGQRLNDTPLNGIYAHRSVPGGALVWEKDKSAKDVTCWKCLQALKRRDGQR